MASHGRALSSHDQGPDNGWVCAICLGGSNDPQVATVADGRGGHLWEDAQWGWVRMGHVFIGVGGGM